MQNVRAPNAVAIVERKLQDSKAREIVKNFSVLNGSAPYVESLRSERVVNVELTYKRYSRTKRHCPDCGAPVGYPYRRKTRKKGGPIRCRKCVPSDVESAAPKSLETGRRKTQAQPNSKGCTPRTTLAQE